jgi:acyl-CoA reductase-like NAD-dependent aldehyde dehydrogenase
MRRSSCLTMPTSTRPWKAPWPANTRNASQTCVCQSPLCPEGVYDQFVTKFAEGHCSKSAVFEDGMSQGR